MQKNVCLIDRDENFLSIMTTALKNFYGGDILASTTDDHAIKVLNASPKPEMIVVDYQLLMKSEKFRNFLITNHAFVPVIATTREEISQAEAIKKCSLITMVLEKPLDTQEFGYLVRKITTAPLQTPAYVPVSFSLLMNLGDFHADLFLKLSESNYIKVIHKEDEFTPDQIQRLKAKGFDQAFIKASTCNEFLEMVSSHLETKSAFRPSSQQSSFAMDALEHIEETARFLGWNSDLLASTQKTIEASIKLLSKNEEIIKTITLKLADKRSLYAHHVGMMSFFLCVLGNQFKWVGESEKIKLVLATLLHDYTVDTELYQDIASWNEKLSNEYKDNSMIRYRQHPLEAAKLVQSIPSFPMDVEQIILQHHEKPDGTGFPRAISAARISYLSTLFILVEELVGYIGDGQYVEAGIEGFIINGKKTYTEGHFKKFFDIIVQQLNKKVA